MPFTPFHLGPACIFKAAAGDSFSLMVFGFAQVAMDAEPLIRLLRGDATLHGFSHTYVGGTIIGTLSVVIGRPVCQFLLNMWAPNRNSHFMSWLRGKKEIGWPAALAGAFFGTYSHVLIDSMVYDDMQPFAPFGASNPLQGQSSFAAMHILCLAAGLLGVSCVAARYLLYGSGPDNHAA